MPHVDARSQPDAPLFLQLMVVDTHEPRPRSVAPPRRHPVSEQVEAQLEALGYAQGDGELEDAPARAPRRR